ncbi:MAG: LCP family protein [Oscillospiraceae bacterium]|jgi:LCP family protein required for cell wall assembly|nr:LCP family protein [Oscillospiraceae bacterium]
MSEFNENYGEDLDEVFLQRPRAYQELPKRIPPPSDVNNFIGELDGFDEFNKPMHSRKSSKPVPEAQGAGMPPEVGQGGEQGGYDGFYDEMLKSRRKSKHNKPANAPKQSKRAASAAAALPTEPAPQNQKPASNHRKRSGNVELRKSEGKKGKKAAKAIVITLLALIFLLGTTVISTVFYFTGMLNHQSRADDTNYDANASFDPEENAEGYEEVDNLQVLSADGIPLKSDKDIINVLLVGIDAPKSQNKGSRSDTMIILSLDKKHKKIKMTSLLRDLYVMIPGRYEDRLNHSHAYGGVDLLIRTIEYNFRVKIDYYTRLNFDTFEEVVDSLGGVDIMLTANEAHIVGEGAHEGMNHLNGAQTETYARIRKIDSDFNRTGRQRKVMTSIINQMKKSDVQSLFSSMNTILPLVTTDIPQDVLVSHVVQAPVLKNYPISEYYVPQKDKYKGYYTRGMSVLSIDIPQAAKDVQYFIYEE